MRTRLAILLALLTVSPAFSALAETPPDIVVPEPSRENKAPAPGELAKFINGTQRTSSRTLADQQRLPFVELLGEDFEGGCGLLPPGWSEQVAPLRSGGWVRDCLDPRLVGAGRESALVKSGTASASVRNSSGGYPAQIDSRLVSPVVDLRWVAGVHADPDALTNDALCAPASGRHPALTEWCANLTANFTKPFPYSRDSLHALAGGIRAQLQAAAAGPFAQDLRTSLMLLPDEASDLPLVEESLGFGMVNLSFWHAWDWKTGPSNDGGLVEIRYQRADGSWSNWQNLEGDLVFETKVRWPALIQETGCAPWMDIQDGTAVRAVTGLGSFTAQNVVPPLCHGLDYWRAGPVTTSLTPEADANPTQPGLSLSALHSRLVEHRPARGPNGRVDTDGSQSAGGATFDTSPDPAGYVGESGGMVYSKYTLNRFIGKQVQVAFRAFSHSIIPTADRGWFVDDVQVTALVPTRDVGVFEVVAPRDGDTVNAANEAVRPQAVIKNFGRSDVSRINVSFEILQGGKVVWGPSLAPGPVELASQRSVVVSAKEYWTSQAGDYQLRVKTWIDSAVGSDGVQGPPQTDVASGNDQALVSFTSRDRRELEIHVRPDAPSLQTDLGGSKAGVVVLENRGNMPLSGTLQVYYDVLDATVNPAVRQDQLVPIGAARHVVVPYGKVLTAIGGENAAVESGWAWNQRVSASDPSPVVAGIYAIVARFTPDDKDAGLGLREGEAVVYVRATPLPALSSTFPYPVAASPYPVLSKVAAVEAVGWGQTPGWSTRAWSYLASVHPTTGLTTNEWYAVRPVSPHSTTPSLQGPGVWVARGEDCRTDNGHTCASGTWNLVDWYVLRKDLIGSAVPAGTKQLDVAFTTEGWFDFFTSADVNRSRGFVRIFPKSMDHALDQARAAGESTGLPGAAPGQVLTYSATPHPCGRLDNMTVEVRGTPFNMLSLVMEEPHAWRDCSLRAHLGWLGSQEVAVEWVYETNRTRLAIRRGDNAPCKTGQSFDPEVCRLTAHAAADRWYLDRISLALTGGASTATYQEGGESPGAGTGSSRAFFGCAYVNPAGERTPNCRGWSLEGIIEAAGKNNKAVATSFSTNWYVESTADRDGTGSVLRYGYLPYEQATLKGATENDGYGGQGRTLEPNVLSTVRSPVFPLGSINRPTLAFWTNFTLSPCLSKWDQDRPQELRAPDGFSVWMVATKGGEERRIHLVPEGNYTHRLFGAASKNRPDAKQCVSQEEALKYSFNNYFAEGAGTGHPYAAAYDRVAGNNVWSDTSNPDELGVSRWMRPLFNLSAFKAPAWHGWEFAVEFQVVSQTPFDSHSGFLRIDDVRVQERAAANDLGVEAILSPSPGSQVGPGQQQVISARVVNAGIFDQSGIAVRYEIRDATGRLVAEQTRTLDAEAVIPGESPGQKGGSVDFVFNQTWVPTSEGAFTLTVRALLHQSLRPYADTNPINDAKSITLRAVNLSAVRIQPFSAVPDEALVTPIISGVGEVRTLRVPIANVGTLPIVLDGERLGELAVAVTIRDEDGATVAALHQAIGRLDVGKSITLEFRDAWRPLKSGLYTVDMEVLVASTAADEMIGDLAYDNSRRLKVLVFNRILPATEEAWSSYFAPAGSGWRQDPGRAGEDSWTWGGPYENGQSGILAMKDLVNLRSIRTLFLVIDHRYALEEGFDAGLVEASTDGGLTWRPIPPRGGYPVNLSTASPMVPDPFQTVPAFSGSSGDFVAYDLDLGAVPGLRRNVALLDADFQTRNPFALTGTGCTGTETQPAPAECLTLAPKEGAGMWFSDKYALHCTRKVKVRVFNGTEVPGNQFNSLTAFPPHLIHFPATKVYFGDPAAPQNSQPWWVAKTPIANQPIQFSEAPCRATWTSYFHDVPWPQPDGFVWVMRWEVIPPTDDPGWPTEMSFPLLDTTKILKVPLTVPAGTRELDLSFYDWRAIGQTVQVRQVSGRLTYTQIAPSSVAVRLVDEAGLEILALVPASPAGQDAYRDWTLNSFRLDEYAPLLAGRTVFLEFEHRLSTGYPQRAFGGTDSRIVGSAEPGDTDWLSPNIGWAIDEIRLLGNDAAPLAVDGGEPGVGSAATPTYRSICHRGSLTNQNRANCPWALTYDSTSDGTDKGPGGWQKRTQLLGNQVWRVEPGVGLVARPSTVRQPQVIPGVADLGRVTGDDSRLILPLDLKSAVGSPILEVNASWKFTDYVHRTGALDPVHPASGGNVEISRDGGATWLPLPAFDANGKEVGRSTICISTPASNTHTPLAGREKDPERNSPFGTCATVLGRQTVPGATQYLRYDLTDFIGKEVLVGFHAFFTTNREVAGTAFPPGPDFWKIQDVRVRAPILDADDLRLRLRAASDLSINQAGWDVRKVEFLGVKHSQNLAVRVVPPGQNGFIPADRVNFTAEVVNKGQTPASATRLAIWVNATDGAGMRDSRYDEFYEGFLSAFTPCVPTSVVSAGDTLAPESSLALCGRGDDPLAFNGLEGYAYTVVARVADAGYASDSILADNADTVVLPHGSVLVSSQLRLASLASSPNTFVPETDSPVTVTAEVFNRGLGKTSLESITLRLTAPDGTERILNPERLETQFNPFQPASFRWPLGPGELNPAHGRGAWTVTAVVVTQGGAVDQMVRRVYVGSTPVSHLGFDDRIGPYDISTDAKEKWFSTTGTPCGGERAWYSHRGTSGGYTNNSREYAFTLPSQDFVGGDGGTTCTQVNILRTPRIRFDPDHLAGHDGVPRLYLNVWSRHSFDHLSHGRIEVRYLNDKEVPIAGTAIPGLAPRALVLLNFTAESTGYASGAFVPVTIDLLGWARDPATEDAAVREALTASNPHFVEVYFVGYGRVTRGWQIDDVSLSPFAVSVGPGVEYPAVDDTDKEYQLVVRNEGSYTDTYRLNVTDPGGRAPNIPLGWHVVLLDSQGRILWHPGSLEAPSGCRPLPTGSSGQPVTAPGIRIDPGKTEIIRAKVCIPISASQAGRSNTATLGITATSQALPFHRTTAPLTLAYSYRERPNLLIPPGGIHVDNVDLPVDQPRTISVTVLNAGPVTAQDVQVRVTDSMDPAFGYAPIILTGVDGKPIAPLATLPSREARTFTFLWTPRASGEHNLTVELDPLDRIRELQEGDNFARLPIRITKAEYPDLFVAVETDNLSPPRGEPTELRLRIENRGAKAATGIQLTFKAGVTDLLIHQGASADDFLNRIGPGETVVLTRSWRPAFPGTIHVIGGALPRSGVLERADTQADNYALVTVKVFSTDFQVEFSAPQVQGRQGEDLRSTFRVVNPGQTDDELALRVTAPSGVIPSLTRDGQRVTNLALGKGENVSLTLDLTLPARLPAGSYPVNVTVRSVNTGASSMGTLVLTVLPAYALAVEAAPAAAVPGLVAVPVLVRNEGNAADSVEVRAAALPPGWSAQPARILLAPFGQGVATLNFTVPGSQAAGVYDLFLVVQDAAGAAANGTLLLAVGEKESLSATLAGHLRGVRPGRPIAAELVVRNDGNVRAEGALRVLAPEGWTARLGRSLVGLEVGEEARVPVTVLVPRSADPGGFHLTLEVTGLRSNRSSAAQVVVTESDLKVADFTFTPRVNIAPGTLVTFNASIVNEGIPAENVTVALYADDFLVGVEKLPLVSGVPRPVTFGWIAQSGEHVLLLLVDPGNVLEEGDEANNARLEVLRTSGEAGILGAARNAVPDAGLLAGLGVVALAAAAARRTVRRQ